MLLLADRVRDLFSTLGDVRSAVVLSGPFRARNEGGRVVEWYVYFGSHDRSMSDEKAEVRFGDN